MYELKTKSALVSNGNFDVIKQFYNDGYDFLYFVKDNNFSYYLFTTILGDKKPFLIGVAGNSTNIKREAAVLSGSQDINIFIHNNALQIEHGFSLGSVIQQLDAYVQYFSLLCDDVIRTMEMINYNVEVFKKGEIETAFSIRKSVIGLAGICQLLCCGSLTLTTYALDPLDISWITEHFENKHNITLITRRTNSAKLQEMQRHYKLCSEMF